MVRIDTLTTTALSAAVQREARALMDVAFAGDFTDADWAHGLGGHHVVATDGARAVVAHAAVVPRALEAGGRTWAAGYVEAVATRPDHLGEGIGSLVMATAATLIGDHHELGALSTGSHRFYERLGWERWQGSSWVRHPGGPVRTPENDDGIMVLRLGPSLGLDLRASISCEAREGDDW